MIQIWNSFHAYIGNGLTFLLYVIALAYLWVREKDQEKRVLFLYMPLSIFVLYFCPLTNHLFQKLLGDEIIYRFLWLLPEILTLGYALVKLVQDLKKPVAKVLVALALVAVFGLSGKYVYANPYFSVAENRFHVPNAVKAVCDSIIIPGREVMAAMPDEMIPYVRQYTANVCMPYGRDAIAGFVPKPDLYLELQKSEIDCEKVASLAKESNVYYIVLNPAKTMNGDFSDYGYSYVNTVAGYPIYLMDGANLADHW